MYEETFVSFKTMYNMTNMDKQVQYKEKGLLYMGFNSQDSVKIQEIRKECYVGPHVSCSWYF